MCDCHSDWPSLQVGIVDDKPVRTLHFVSAVISTGRSLPPVATSSLPGSRPRAALPESMQS